MSLYVLHDAYFSLSASSPSTRFEIAPETGRWELRDALADRMMLRGASPVFGRPTVDGVALEPVLERVEPSDGGAVTLHYTAPGLRSLRAVWRPIAGADALELQISLTAERACELNRLALFPAGTGIDMIDVVNFRNQHNTAATWPELPLGGKHGCDTTTYSDDWQFAPHPTLLLLRHNTACLAVGAFDLPETFGMYLKAKGCKLEHWYVDYGAAPHGRPLAAGETLMSARFRVFLRQAPDPHAVFAEFGAMLVAEGQIPDPARKQRHTWWTEPLYCTWIDQCFGSANTPAAELQEQNALPSKRILTDALVRRAVSVIQRERLPFRTILLDEGWHVTRGQWEAHPDRFPDLRGLVDELHAAGFKVVVWWTWAEIAEGAKVDPAHLIGGGKRNRHKCLMRDYSHPRVQEEYLKPLFRQLFSSEPGCYNLDGFKSDFLADKVHADMPVHDPAWRGEEAYFFHLTRLCYDTLKRYTPDGIHIGCAGNYWLADDMDVNRTYDVNHNWYDHETRGAMLRATAPGVPMVYDFHNHLDGLAEWFRSAKATGAGVQIGNILWTKGTTLDEPREADAAFYELLRGLMAE